MSTLLSTNGSNKKYYNTAMGNVVSVQDAIAGEVRDIIVDIEPIQTGSGDPSPTNIRPISGVTSVSVTRTGKNLFNLASVGRASSGASITLTNTGFRLKSNENKTYCRARSGSIKLKGGITYTFSVDVQIDSGLFVMGFAIPNADQTQSGIPSTRVSGSYEVQYTPNADEEKEIHIFCTFSTSEIGDITCSNIQFEAGADATAYEPYQGQSVTVSLVEANNDPLTVYGGRLDAATGILAVTHKVVTLSSSVYFNKSARTDLPSGFYLFYTNGYSANYIFSDAPFSGNDDNPNGVIMYSNYYPIGDTSYSSLSSKTGFAIGVGQSANYSDIGIMTDAASTITEFYQWLDAQDPPIQIAYPLATPLTYTLTPAQLSALSGCNNFWSSNGKLMVKYPCDPTMVSLPE